MKRALLVGLGVAVIVAAAPAASARSHPALRLARGTDALVVYGAGFYANERVRVTVVARTQSSQVVRTRAAGTFAARFGGVSANPCDAVAVQAVGRRGDRAVLKIPPRACIPARSP